MKYSALTRRIGGDAASVWDLLYRAWDRQEKGEDIIILSVGDPDFDTPKVITETAVSSLREGATHYVDVSGIIGLRKIIADSHHRQTGMAATADQVVVMNGAQCALYSAAQCLLEAGTEIIIPEPMYTTYEAVIGASGAQVVRVAATSDNDFHVRPCDIEAAVTDKTRAILLNTPNNPTGAVLSIAALEEIADICRRYDLWLISDEVYSTIVYEQEHISPCALPGMAERTITINSLSKSHAMTGWRIGWAVVPPEMALHLSNLALCMLFGIPGFVQEAAKTALTADIPELDLMKQTYQRRRDTLYGELQAIEGVECHLPQASIFLMADIRCTGLSSQKFADHLLDYYDVSVLPGHAFGPSGEGHVRLSLAVTESELVRASERFALCVNDLLKLKKRA